jgi:hypothetical protein
MAEYLITTKNGKHIIVEEEKRIQIPLETQREIKLKIHPEDYLLDRIFDTMQRVN